MLGTFSLGDLASFGAENKIANATADVYEGIAKSTILNNKLDAAIKYSGKRYGAMTPAEQKAFDKWYEANN